jgi:hypothetical protein
LRKDFKLPIEEGQGGRRPAAQRPPRVGHAERSPLCIANIAASAAVDSALIAAEILQLRLAVGRFFAATTEYSICEPRLSVTGCCNQRACLDAVNPIPYGFATRVAAPFAIGWTTPCASGRIDTSLEISGIGKIYCKDQE